MGDGNGSHIGTEPIIQRPMWGALGSSRRHLGVTFVSKLAMEADTERRLGVEKRFVPIRSVRSLGKSDMVLNDRTPEITVDSQTFDVFADGRKLWHEPFAEVPLNRLHMLR